ncbi:hypothetical protein [Enterobacter sp.]|uniref:hypothetical protein n=1 Tax=Enterobacter sp. TaxID=42895 RepID=UPI00298179E2|nr:hypothetical protein [Enterobacter sp.]
MPFEMKKVTKEESIEMLTQHKELELVYRKAGGGSISSSLKPVYWFVNEEEDASFCLLDLGSSPAKDGKTRFMLRINDDYIILQLDGFNTVIFLHDSPLFEKELYRVKYLIAAAFSISGRWGDGDTDHVNAVPDPVFKFH